MTPTASDVQRTLALLGSTADQIAAALANKGVTGERRTTQACPLAVYLRQEYGVRISVGSLMSMWGDWVAPGRYHHYADHTAAQAEFVDLFDIGMYPELIA